MVARKLALAALTVIPLALAAVDRAQARTIYDGSWNVAVNGQTADCQGTFNYSVQIVNGIVGYSGGDASVSGRVGASGFCGGRRLPGMLRNGIPRTQRHFRTAGFVRPYSRDDHRPPSHIGN